MTERVEIGIRGMSCASCVARVERALQKQDDIIDAQVNLATEKAVITFEERANPSQAAEAIEEAGYQPVVEEADIPVIGMTCGSCVSRVERSIEKLPGILQASVNLTTQKAFVRFLPGLYRCRVSITPLGMRVMSRRSLIQANEPRTRIRRAENFATKSFLPRRSRSRSCSSPWAR